jgi:flagellar basal-body rod protein FlgC
MVSPISTSLAALQVNARRIEVSANNLANQQATTTRRGDEVTNEAYKPHRVVVTNEGGVPKANVETVANPTQKLYLPESPQADEAGFVEVPNVDQASELVEMKMASYDYKANLQAIKVQQNTEDYLLDILS